MLLFSSKIAVPRNQNSISDQSTRIFRTFKCPAFSLPQKRASLSSHVKYVLNFLTCETRAGKLNFVLRHHRHLEGPLSCLLDTDCAVVVSAFAYAGEKHAHAALPHIDESRWTGYQPGGGQQGHHFRRQLEPRSRRTIHL